jgi:GxxExxY protein
MLEHHDLTEAIIGAAIEVQRKLGAGFLESIYERSLCIELRRRNIEVVQQPVIQVFYDEHPVGVHRLDLIAEDTIVVELKATNAIDDAHLAVVRSYLKAAGKKHGLILNFGRMPLDVKRVIAT